jgi:hypothetical protein
MKTISILARFIKQGFSLKFINDLTVKLDHGISVIISNSDLQALDFRFMLEDEGLVAQLQITHLQNETPTVSIGFHDMISLYSHSVSATSTHCIETFSKKVEYVNLIRTSVIALLEDLRPHFHDLQRQSSHALEAQHLQKQAQEKKSTENRITRIADYESKFKKIGETDAKNIMTAMEKFCAATKGSCEHIFDFLATTGLNSKRIYRVVWKKQQLAWQGKGNNLVDPYELIDVLSKARVPVDSDASTLVETIIASNTQP